MFAVRSIRGRPLTCPRTRPPLAAAPRCGPCLQNRLVFSDSHAHVVKPYYITTPIFYPNSVPHIGHLYSLVTADILARFRRLVDPSTTVHFLAGTDEHGLKIQQAAQAQNMLPLQFCDTVSERFKVLTDVANISNTTFVRTSEDRHHATVEHVWKELNAKRLIYKGSYSGWYSISDECFYSDTQITRTSLASPDGSPTELVTSTETGSVVERYEEQNYMFRLSAFRESLLAHYVTNPSSIFPSHHHAHIVDILKSPEGLEDLSISRPRERLSWGVGVPGDEEQTVYVWFDALLVYLTGVGYPWPAAVNSRDTGWPADIQVIGKDILRFHAIYFPAMLQALSLPLPAKLLTHSHWTANQKKMSKSIGNVADPFEAMKTFGTDVVRFYLARVGGGFRDDVDWSSEQLAKHSREIQSYLGNFYLRITSPHITHLASMARQRTRERIYNHCLFGGTEDPLFDVIVKQMSLAEEVKQCLDRLEVGKALQLIVDLLKNANVALTKVAPWSSDPDTARRCYVVFYETLRVAGICLQPFMPAVTQKLLDALQVPREERNWRDAIEGRDVLDVKFLTRWEGGRFF